MDLKQLAKMYQSNELKTLSKEDSFSFACKGCGECCYNREDIILSPYDIYRASKHLKMKPKDFLEKYCTWYIGESSHLPMTILNFRKNDLGGYTFCPFMKKREGKGMCSIHEAKPFVCAVFPLGRIIPGDMGAEGIKYFNQFDSEDTGCGTADSTQTVQEWLSSYGIEDSEKASLMLTQYVSKLNATVNLKKMNESKKIPENIKDAFYSSIFFQMYADMDLERDFFEIMEENIKLATYKAKALAIAAIGIADVNIKGKAFEYDKDEIDEMVDLVKKYSKQE